MNKRPMTPPQSVANCWTVSATVADGSEGVVTCALSAGSDRSSSRGEGDVDAQAPELGVLEAQRAAVERDLLGDDGQADPAAGRGGGRSAGEGLEQVAALAGGHSGAVVLHAHVQRAVLAAEPGPHRARRAAV